jgi:hypothetical protein
VAMLLVCKVVIGIVDGIAQIAVSKGVLGI